jgi:hypothetical protein
MGKGSGVEWRGDTSVVRHPSFIAHRSGGCHQKMPLVRVRTVSCSTQPPPGRPFPSIYMLRGAGMNRETLGSFLCRGNLDFAASSSCDRHSSHEQRDNV